jgi:hypothetical protein
MSHTKYREETNCLNCGTEVTRKFCPECGQQNLDTHENFFHLAGHFIADYFHYDSKFIRSLVPLFIRPGFLTRQYWDGKRVRYIHPLRLYFFVSIIFMISATYFYHHFEKQIKGSVIQSNVTIEEGKVDIGATPEERKSKKTAEKKEEEKAIGKLESGIDRFVHDLKYISFFMVPLYALVFRLLYIRRKSFYVDHLVYTLHVQSFAYALISVMLLIPFLFPDSISIVRRVALLTIMTYIALSLRYLYHQPWWKTILKSIVGTLLLALFMGLTLGIYMMATLLIEK